MIVKEKSPLISIPNYDGIGIYAIGNQCNNKMYVGSSKNINARLKTHRKDMRDLICNKKILADIDEGHSFVAIVLEEIEGSLTHNELLTKERLFSEIFNTVRQGYNHHFIAGWTYNGDKKIIKKENNC